MGRGQDRLVGTFRVFLLWGEKKPVVSRLSYRGARRVNLTEYIGAWYPESRESVMGTLHELLQQTIVWDNHACMPLRPGDLSFLPQLERVRKSGIDVISLNVSFDALAPHEAFLMLAT